MAQSKFDRELENTLDSLIQGFIKNPIPSFLALFGVVGYIFRDKWVKIGKNLYSENKELLFLGLRVAGLLALLWVLWRLITFFVSKKRFMYTRFVPSTETNAKNEQFISLARSFYDLHMPYYLRFLIRKRRISFVVAKDGEGKTNFYVGSDRYFSEEIASLFVSRFTGTAVYPGETLVFPSEQRKLPFGFSVFTKKGHRLAFQKVNQDILGTVSAQLPNLSVMQVTFSNYSLRKFRKQIKSLEKDVLDTSQQVKRRTSDERELLKDTGKRFESDEVVYRVSIGFSSVGKEAKNRLFSAFNTVSSAMNDSNKLKRWRNRFATSRFLWVVPAFFQMTLTGSELATLVHLPVLDEEKTPEAVLEAVTHLSDRLNRIEPDVLADESDILLGVLDDPVVKNRNVYIQRRFLGEHFGCFGGTGSGKSTLLNAILKNGFFDPFIASKATDVTVGATILDPAQDTVKTFLNYLLAQEKRGATIHWEKVHYFRIADSDYPLPMNILKKIDGVKIDAQADAITEIIDNVFDVKAEVASRLLRFCIYTLLADEEYTHTILEVPKLIDDDVYRDQMLLRISKQDPVKAYELNHYWLTDAKENIKTSATAVKNRIDLFSSSENMRMIFGQQDNQLLARKYMDEGHFVFFDLSNLNQKESNVIASYISYIYYRTAEMRPVGANLHMLISDETHRIGNVPSFPKIVAESRKFGLALGIATQRLKQLSMQLQGELNNTQNNFFICRQGREDAKLATGNLEHRVTTEQLQSLKPRHAVCKYPYESPTRKRDRYFFAVEVPPLDKFDQNGQVIPFSDSEAYQKAVDEVNRWTLESVNQLMKNRGYADRETVRTAIYEQLIGKKHSSQAMPESKNESEAQQTEEKEVSNQGTDIDTKGLF